MESLSEYLIEAVAKRTTGKYSTFPNRPDKDEIVMFLEGKGFENEDVQRQTNRSNGKYYIIGEENPSKAQTFWIKFGDTNIRPFKEFFCRYENLNHFSWVDYMVDSPVATSQIDTFEDFREQVCEYFGWK